MPHCAAVGCSNEAKNKRDPSISFHRVPLEGEISKKWLAAIGRPLSNLPKQPHLCSHHFEPHCFDESVDLWNRLMRDKPRSRELKPDAIPTIFAHKPAPNVRTLLVWLEYGKPNVAIFNITIFIQFNPYIDLIFLYLFNLIL